MENDQKSCQCERYREVLMELLKWCEPDEQRWNYMSAIEHAQALLADGGKEGDGWISIEDGLPEDGEMVDTWNGEANRRSIFKNIAGGIFDRHVEPHANERIYAIHFPDVSHWRLLPPAPQTK